MTETEKFPASCPGRSRMAEGIAMHRAKESLLPEDERICYDPFAVRFIDPAILKFARDHPVEAKAKLDEMDNHVPGLGNSVRARVRYFDDCVARAIADGIVQIVILGAGYDTRAHRIGGVAGHARVFEVDRSATQEFKKEKIREIFGSLPAHVTYVPMDCETERLEDCLVKNGYLPDAKTLFLLEGFVMYIPPEAVDEIFAFICSNAGEGSRVIFDYFPQSVFDGTNPSAIAANIRNAVRQIGEPLKSGIPDGTVHEFLTDRGFSKIRNVTGADYKKLYFHGKSAGRQVCDLLAFAEAEVR